MSEEQTLQQEVSEDDLNLLKSRVHESLVSSLSFAEVVQIMNNMLVKEAEDRIANMSQEEIGKAVEELKEALKKQESETQDKVQ